MYLHRRASGNLIWTGLALLFFLSFLPFTTAGVLSNPTEQGSINGSAARIIEVQPGTEQYDYYFGIQNPSSTEETWHVRFMTESNLGIDIIGYTGREFTVTVPPKTNFHQIPVELHLPDNAQPGSAYSFIWTAQPQSNRNGSMIDVGKEFSKATFIRVAGSSDDEPTAEPADQEQQTDDPESPTNQPATGANETAPATNQTENQTSTSQTANRSDQLNQTSPAPDQDDGVVIGNQTETEPSTPPLITWGKRAGMVVFALLILGVAYLGYRKWRDQDSGDRQNGGNSPSNIGDLIPPKAIFLLLFIPFFLSPAAGAENYTTTVNVAGDVQFHFFDTQTLNHLDDYEITFMNTENTSNVKEYTLIKAFNTSTDVSQGIDMKDTPRSVDSNQNTRTYVDTFDVTSDTLYLHYTFSLHSSQDTIKVNSSAISRGSSPKSEVTLEIKNVNTGNWDQFDQYQAPCCNTWKSEILTAQLSNPSQYLNSQGEAQLRLKLRADGQAEFKIWEVYKPFEAGLGIFQQDSLTINGSWLVSAKAPDYTMRQYKVTIPPNATTQKSVYLLKSSNSVFFTFYTIEQSSNQPIENALITVQKYLPTNNAYTTIAQFQTNPDGSASFPLSINTNYRVQATKPGYEPLAFQYTPDPNQRNMVLKLNRLDGQNTSIFNFSSIFDGLTYSLNPEQGTYRQPIKINYSIVQSGGKLAQFGMAVLYRNTSNISAGEQEVFNKTIANSPTGGLINYTANASGKYRVKAYFKLKNGTIYSVTERTYWRYQKGLSLAGIVSPFTYWLFAILITAMIMIAANQFTGSGVATAILGDVILGGFVALNPSATIGGVAPWLMWLFVTFLTVGIALYQMR